MSIDQKDTKQRILNAAEELFAHRGFQGTSLRALTKKAAVNLAAVNYHFGTKEALIEEVITRRLIPLNVLRQDKINAELDAAQKENRSPEAKTLLRAFIEPTLSFSCSNPGGSHFTTLIGRALAESDETVMPIFLRHIEPLYMLLFTSLCQAMPELPKSTIYWRLHFVLGSLIHTMKMTKKPLQVPPEIVPDENPEQLSNLLINFVSAGMDKTT